MNNAKGALRAAARLNLCLIQISRSQAVHGAKNVNRHVRYFPKPTLLVGMNGRSIAFSNMGIKPYAPLPSQIHLNSTDQGAGVSSISTLRSRLQPRQKHPILPRLQPQSADANFILHPKAVNRPGHTEKAVTQIFIKILLRQSDTPIGCFMGPTLPSGFRIALGVHRHQLSKGQFLHRSNNPKHFPTPSLKSCVDATTPCEKSQARLPIFPKKVPTFDKRFTKHGFHNCGFPFIFKKLFTLSTAFSTGHRLKIPLSKFVVFTF